jgi:hypothetical protein
MRKAGVELCVVLLVIASIHTLRIMRSGFINGKVYPANSVESVMAVNGTDSVKAVSEDGSFAMMLNPGIWKVVVGMKEQTRNVIRENVEVIGGKQINLGEIRLSE